MPRPRGIDDDVLLDHVAATIADSGVAGLTLQSVADRAGVSAATLINRFGSKRGMLVALDRRWAESVDAEVDHALTAESDPVRRVRATALLWTGDLEDPTVLANVLSGLAADLLDTELRELLGAGWGALRRRLTELVADCHRAGRLAGSPPAEQAARMLFALAEGTRLAWSVQPEGSLRARAEADLDALLAGWDQR